LTTAADLVRDNCTALAGYRAALERHVTQASSPGGGMAPRPADAPFPGDPQAFAALMVIWEKVPRLEAALRLAVAGHPGLRRGGSSGNFLEALAAIPGLAAGLDEDAEALAGRILEWLVDVARAVPAIDEAERWRPVPSRACPYCGCFFLKVMIDSRGQPAGRVGCFGHLGPGEPCRAAWGSLAEIAQDLERAETVPDVEE
jgi:hypothetical protein